MNGTSIPQTNLMLPSLLVAVGKLPACRDGRLVDELLWRSQHQATDGVPCRVLAQRFHHPRPHWGQVRHQFFQHSLSILVWRTRQRYHHHYHQYHYCHHHHHHHHHDLQPHWGQVQHQLFHHILGRNIIIIITTTIINTITVISTIIIIITTIFSYMGNRCGISSFSADSASWSGEQNSNIIGITTTIMNTIIVITTIIITTILGHMRDRCVISSFSTS